MDDFTIKSLSRCIVSNKLEIGKDVVANEWFEERLSEEVAQLHAEASNL